MALSAQARALEAGQPAPAFILPAVAENGPAIALEDYRGKVVYLDFWSSWCAPCRRTMPKLTAMREQWPRRKFEVLALSLDTNRRDALRFLEQAAIVYPAALDLGGATARRYGVSTLPAAFIIDAEGEVQQVLKGPEAEDFALIRQLVAALAGS